MILYIYKTEAFFRTQNEAFQLELEQTSSQIQLKSTQIEKLTELLENEKSKVNIKIYIIINS